MNSAAKMRNIGEKVMEIIPGVGFILIVCDANSPGYSNYVSSLASKPEIVATIEELLEKIKKTT